MRKMDPHTRVKPDTNFRQQMICLFKCS